ncbi:hypothetical protein KIS4809_4191 [Bacillus sp. ZZV12-4809]|nr:hypothetical protein KIS4809_4191 [Bacillus sp. ZZV12-4809]
MLIITKNPCFAAGVFILRKDALCLRGLTCPLAPAGIEIGFA